MKKIAVLLAALTVFGVCEVIPATSNIMNTTVVANAEAFTEYKVKLQDKKAKANVRKSPNMNSEVIGKKKNGDILYVVNDNGTWVQFRYGKGNGYGYMARSLVEKTGIHGYF